MSALTGLDQLGLLLAEHGISPALADKAAEQRLLDAINDPERSARQ